MDIPGISQSARPALRLPAASPIRAGLLTLLLILAACGPDPDQRPADLIVIGQTAEPKSLDPQTTTALNDFRILVNLYEGLVRFRPGGLEPEPALAETRIGDLHYLEGRHEEAKAAYLREAQNPDGGWGVQRGQPSDLYTTLHVLLALQTAITATPIVLPSSSLIT